MMKERRENRRCQKYRWFGRMAHHCRRKEIEEQRRKKLVCRGNKFAPLQSKVYRKMEAVHPGEGKV